MRHSSFLRSFALIMIIFLGAFGAFAQTPRSSDIVIVDLVEEDMTPGIIQSLPDYPNIKSAHILNSDDMRKSLGNRPVLDLIDFNGGTVASSADYEAGKLLIVEYQTPQASVDADNQIKQFLTANQENPPIAYRRIGNFSVFVFDGNDEAAAHALLDRIKYQRSVQWLGENQTLIQRAERAFVRTTSEVFFSTMLAIVLGMTSSVVVGIAGGFLFFYLREQKRATMTAFSDAGGMTRLNLDDLTPDVSPERFLKE